MKFHSPYESFLWLKALWQQRRNSKLTRSRLEAAQLLKFRRLVSYAQQHSPFYRALISKRKIDVRTCLPSDFPILTKDIVMANFDDLVTDRNLTHQRIAEFLARSSDPTELFQGRYHVLHSSGTSGAIGHFVFSHRAWIKGAGQVVRVSPLRLRRRIALVAATRGHFAGVSLMLAGNDGTNALFFNVRTFDIGRPFQDLIKELNQFQPQVLSGYATILKVLAEAQQRGELRIRPAEIGSGGEPLLADVKALLERTFHAPVLNGYASSEHLYMAMTLPGATGLQLMEDDLIFELRNDCTLVTNLFNETMPLIRYRMDDVLIPDPSARNPYPYTRIKEIIGRQEDALVFTNDLGQDDFIHPIIIAELIIPGVTAWQIVLQSKTAFCFRARFDTALTHSQKKDTYAAIRGRLTNILAEKRMLNVHFEIDEVDVLNIDRKTGKFRLVDRDPHYEVTVS